MAAREGEGGVVERRMEERRRRRNEGVGRTGVGNAIASDAGLPSRVSREQAVTADVFGCAVNAARVADVEQRVGAGWVVLRGSGEAADAALVEALAAESNEVAAEASIEGGVVSELALAAEVEDGAALGEAGIETGRVDLAGVDVLAEQGLQRNERDEDGEGGCTGEGVDGMKPSERTQRQPWHCASLTSHSSPARVSSLPLPQVELPGWQMPT